MQKQVKNSYDRSMGDPTKRENQSELVDQYTHQGYIGPFQLFDQKQGAALVKEFAFPNDILTWYKSIHEKSDPVVRTAKSEKVLSKLIPILGNDILLWGSSFIEQAAGKTHNWHLDVEHGKWDGATLWLGLKNLNQDTTVSLITRSHLIDTAPQAISGLDVANDEAVLAAARKYDPACELVTLRLKAGEFIIWSGRVWHNTHNRSSKNRFAIILQYCSPSQQTFVPLTYEYPNTKWGTVKPPCALVHGKDEFHLNTLIPEKTLFERYYHRVQRSYYGAKKILRPYKQKAKTLISKTPN